MHSLLSVNYTTKANNNPLKKKKKSIIEIYM